VATYLTTNAIPLTTSATANIIASGSSPTYPIYGAYDRNANTGWTSNAAQKGWLGYNFQRDIIIYKYSVTVCGVQYSATPKSWTFEGSNDGSTWAVLDTISNVTNWSASIVKQEYTISNPRKFIQYRLNVSDIGNAGAFVLIGELEMFEMILINKILISLTDGSYRSIKAADENVNVIPAMTSSTTPSGIVNSSQTSSGFLNWKAFDGVATGNGWLGNGTSAWISYEFPLPKNIIKYTLVTDYTTNSAPKNWTFEGSNDGTNWVVLDTRNDVVGWVLKEKKEFILDANAIKAYKFYKINISINNGNASYTSLTEIEMMERLGQEYYLNTASESEYIKYGLEKTAIINLTSSLTEKIFIEQTSTTLGSGKVFKQTINTSNVPIKKASIT
jgi:hypothetical protein